MKKKNEIVAIPELLDKIQIKGQIVTIDAMGTQITIKGEIKKNGQTVNGIEEKSKTVCGEDVSKNTFQTKSSKKRSVKEVITKKPRKKHIVRSR